eukprot:TRINITY_DN3744_c0_g1_i2.p1 TRINITY_DN3744_c0_g1~~TRINITY_DN3744_c0_g1_i2.p1  ORF type:complete len:148 (+),score=9.15 TRINITY_DN3744_c0_g1_i2:190-633(+)
MAVKTVARNPCDHDPIGHCGGCISSILDVGDWYLKPIWGFTAGQVAGKSYSLDDIEGMLRDPPANMGNFTEDSRLHAAIVCASISCPNLRNEAFSPSDNVYNFQMTDQMQSFLSNNKVACYTRHVSDLSHAHSCPIFAWSTAERHGP